MFLCSKDKEQAKNQPTKQKNQDILAILITFLTNIPFCFLEHLPLLWKASSALAYYLYAAFGARECGVMK